MNDNLYVFKQSYDYNCIKEGTIVRISHSFEMSSRMDRLHHLMTNVFTNSCGCIGDQELNDMIRDGIVVKI